MSDFWGCISFRLFSSVIFLFLFNIVEQSSPTTAATKASVPLAIHTFIEVRYNMLHINKPVLTDKKRTNTSALFRILFIAPTHAIWSAAFSCSVMPSLSAVIIPNRIKNLFLKVYLGLWRTPWYTTLHIDKIIQSMVSQ